MLTALAMIVAASTLQARRGPFLPASITRPWPVTTAARSWSTLP